MAGERSKRRRRIAGFKTATALPFVGIVLFGVPLALGGAYPWSVPVATTLCLIACAITGFESGAFRDDRLVHALLLAIGATVVQLTPLPARLVALIARHSAEVTASAHEGTNASFSGWATIHVDPGSGYVVLQYLVGILAMYLATSRLAARGHTHQVERMIAGSAAWIACLALAHKLLAIDTVYGLYTPRWASPPIVSPLLNPNHLAAYVAIGAILWTARALAATGYAESIVSGAAAALCGAVCILTLSRGGVAAAAGGIFALLLLRGIATKKSASSRARRVLRLLPALGLLASAVALIGIDAIRREYAIGDLAKLRICGAMLRSVPAHWLGAGFGGANAAVTETGALPANLTYTWAESLPVDVVVALGPFVGVVVLFFAARWLFSVRPRVGSNRPAAIGLYAALLAAVAHDLFDFSLWLGACGMACAAIAGLLRGESSARPEPSTRPPCGAPS